MYFAIVVVVDILLDLDDDLHDLIIANRSLPARFGESGANFFSVEWFANAVLFDNLQVRFLDPLEGCISPLAGQTLSSPPNREGFVAGTRVDDSVVVILAEGTFHIRQTAYIRDIYSNLNAFVRDSQYEEASLRLPFHEPPLFDYGLNGPD